MTFITITKHKQPSPRKGALTKNKNTNKKNEYEYLRNLRY